MPPRRTKRAESGRGKPVLICILACSLGFYAITFEQEEDQERVRQLCSPKKRRKLYLGKQTELITDYFDQQIADRNFPTSMECNYKTQFLDRTP